MQKWEYLRLKVTYKKTNSVLAIDSVVLNGKDYLSKENFQGWEALHVYFNKLGLEGWELVSSNSDDSSERFYFKHPM